MIKLNTLSVMGALLVASEAVLGAGQVVKAPAATEKMGYGHAATLAPMKQAPTLDGKIGVGEWDTTVGTINFLKTDGLEEPSFMGMHMDFREGRTWVGYFGDTLYIAMISALPPRAVYGSGKHSLEKPRDAELIGDYNAIEIWVDPNRDRRESGKGDQAFYQFFVNSVGSLYDAKLTPGKGMDKGWNTDVRVANSVDNDRKIWITEIAIPLKDFGWTAENLVGKSMGLLVARNYKGPWLQPTWFPHGGPFLDWYRYPRIYLTKDEPVVCIESLGEKFWEAQPEFIVRIANPGPARTARVAMHIRTSDMPDLKNEQLVELPANGVANYTNKLSSGVLHDTADHIFKLRVTSADGAQAWFDYAGMWSRNPRTTKGSGPSARQVRWNELRKFEQKWEMRATASPENSVSVAAYPSLKQIVVGLNAEMLVADPDGADKDKMSDSALVTVARDGQQVAQITLRWDLARKQIQASHTFAFPDFAEGEYVVTTVFNNYAQPIVKQYKRLVFPWEGTHVGVTDKIYPPFEAVKASVSNTLVVGRSYGVGNLGLWSSVKSLNKEILAGPIVVKVKSETSDVKREMLDVKRKTAGVKSEMLDVRSETEEILVGQARLVTSLPMMAVYEAEAKHPAVTVKTRCTTELDGCMKVELTLLPPENSIQKSGARIQNEGISTNSQQLTTLNSLVLEIPLQDKMVPYWHAVTTALRVNPAGDVPAGQGVVWDSRQFPNGDWIGNFTPYIWLGGAERGLAVFANNDKGWALNWNQKKEFAPCQELIRKDGVLTLRLNLVQKPVDLAAEAAGSNAQPRKIVLGFMASPGKPIPYKDWRGLTVQGMGLGKGFEYLPMHRFDMGWSVETTFSAAYPYNRDYSVYDARMRNPGTAGGDYVSEHGVAAFMEDWKKRNGLDKPASELTDPQKYALGRTSIANSGPRDGYFSMYWDEYYSDFNHPERQVFNGEWLGNGMCQSRLDFRCYYAAETVKRGIGLYFDNSFPHASTDRLTSDAYEIPGLGVQASAGLWEQRDYHRRIWNIHREFGAKSNCKPMQTIHMTNTGILPMLTWNDLNLDLEWFFGPEPQQSKYGIGLLTAETLGRQFGCIPYAIAKIESCRNATEQRTAERTRFGAMMVHEIRITLDGEEIRKLAKLLFGFGYGLAGVINSGETGETVYNYWADDFPVTCDRELVKSLLVKRGDELLLLVCSWDREPCQANFVFDTKALGLTLSTARNAEGSLEQQRAEGLANIEAARKVLADKQVAVADVKKRFADQLAVENQVKAAEVELKKAEVNLVKAEEFARAAVETAQMPISFSARKNRLTVDLERYGVRIIRLK